MRKGFVGGLITGGVVTAMALYSMKQKRMKAYRFKKAAEDLMNDTKEATAKTRKIVKGVRKMASDWME